MAAVVFSLTPAKLCSLASSSSLLPAKNFSFRSRIRCSAETEPESSSQENIATTASPPPPATSETAVESSKLPHSLISVANVQKALRGIAITDVDHYGKLGIPRGASDDEVNAAYKEKREELMNQGLEEEQLNKEIELLKESYMILSSEDERRLYDWSLARSDRPERYTWPFEADITQTPKETPPPREPEDVGPTRIVGYFFLAWLILSVVLSVSLNR
ncbi:DnaJ domain-containing protein [Dioscorea alata]|uniref:DnaJ domain-containing protein n=1 Tax=Dioscorea alata TaxID=55571 RepID=A0ACB7VYT3_DIOAL|nr:DnaJ domain-containing protein [Dioscorea alata]